MDNLLMSTSDSSMGVCLLMMLFSQPSSWIFARDALVQESNLDEVSMKWRGEKATTKSRRNCGKLPYTHEKRLYRLILCRMQRTACVEE